MIAQAEYYMHFKNKVSGRTLIPDSSCSELNNSQAYDFRNYVPLESCLRIKISTYSGNKKEKTTDKIGTYII